MHLHRSNPRMSATPAHAGVAAVLGAMVGLLGATSACSSAFAGGERSGIAGRQTRTDPAAPVARSEDLGLFEQMLVDPSVPTTFRQEAAVRIARTGSDEAAAILAGAIEGGDETRRTLIGDALKTAGPLDSPISRVVAVAAADDRLSVEVAAAVLAVSGESATTEIADLFRATAEPTRRGRLIDVLGRLPDPTAPGVLVAAIQNDPDPAEAGAIDLALQRWSNSRVSRTPAAWAAWWDRLNVEGNGSAALRRLTNRIVQEAARADTEALRAEAAEARAEQLARRLAESHARLLALLPEEERLALVQGMLEDEEGRIRTAAIGQVERMLRDARVLPEGVRRGLLDRLADVDPSIRIKAAKVLDTIGVEELGPALVRLLEGEADLDVVRSGLLVLGNRPQASAADFAVRQLSSEDPETVRLAARVLATLSGAGLLHPDDRDRVRVLIEDGLLIEARETARLAVLVAEDPDADQVVALLLSSLETVQRGAAEAYRTRGRRELLHRHASSPTVARIAVQAWADPDGGFTAVSVERLLELQPAAAPGGEVSADLEADLATWRSAMGRVLEAMPGSQLGATAERLRGVRDFVDPRIAALRRGTDDATLSTVERTNLHRLLAETLVEAGRPAEAASELRAAGAEAADSPLRGDLFEVLLLAAEWGEAAVVEPDPEAWLAALDRRVEAGDPSADAIRAEIARRFGSDEESAGTGAREAGGDRIATEPAGVDRR